MLFQHFGQSIKYLQQGHLPNRSGSGKTVAPAAELAKNFPHVHLGDTGAADKKDSLPHARGDDQGIEIFHVPEFMGKHRQIADEVIDAGVCNGNLSAVDGDGFKRAEQLVQQFNLLGRQLLDQGFRDKVEVGTVAEKEGRGVVIADGGGIEGQTAGILIKSEHHDCGFLRRGGDPLIAEDFCKKGDGRPNRFNMLLRPGNAGFARMMIVNVNFDTAFNEFGQRTDTLRLANIDKDQATDGREIKIAQPQKIIAVGAAATKKFPHAALLGARKYHLPPPDKAGAPPPSPQGNRNRHSDAW